MPDWASPPGATISDILEDRGYTVTEFARNIGDSVDNAEKLLTGAIRINGKLAEGLEKALGISATFWLSREMQFRKNLERLTDNMQWVADFPYADMAAYGWVKQTRDVNDRIAACLNFFGVPTVADWYLKYEGKSKLAAFRTSEKLSSDEAAVLAWLRKGEIDASAIHTGEWDRKRFERALPTIRALTRKKDPAAFIPELKKICAECGVAIVVARPPSGCRASGATRFLSPTKALLMLSFRFLSDDHFWFTFFHEAGHLVLHDATALFLEGGELCSGKEEKEANDFASNLLVPPEYQQTMKALPLDAKAVMRFARDIGISPGIVVGQLQHAKILTHRQLNHLKVRYQWV
jgi:plasmid maintenance system antidote protein VapI